MEGSSCWLVHGTIPKPCKTPQRKPRKTAVKAAGTECKLNPPISKIQNTNANHYTMTFSLVSHPARHVQHILVMY